MAGFEVVPLGDCAVIVRLRDSLGEVLDTAHRLTSAELDKLEEIVPAFASIGLFFSAPPDLDQTLEKIHAALRSKTRRRRSLTKPRSISIGVCYDEEFAPDLKVVAQHCGLSPNEIVKRHVAGRYEVRCVGFTPGFPYLSGLAPELSMPRRATPRSVVPAGSVAIGGRQTGIYPLASPGGWNIIGRTPLRLFDPAREPAALLRAGDRVRFVAITAGQFKGWLA
jgi:inhibitor of KinA